MTHLPDQGPQPFQVDLRGVVDLLSRHIYSSPRVYLRELLQNGRDAIAARAEFDAASGAAVASGRGIRISPIGTGNQTFVFRDDGIGLTADEVAELLATVGRSSKRDIFDLPRSDYLGQFGIGLLSCFMVADSIVIRSRSAKGGAPVEWIGSSDGTFSVRELDEDLPIGTSVHLTPRFDQGELLGTDAVRALATQYGQYLPVSVLVDLPAGGSAPVGRPAAFLDSPAGPYEPPADEVMRFGQELIGARPFDVIPLTVPGTGTTGAAFVLPFAPPPGSRQSTTVYLGRMLLGDRVEDVLPEWAFFVRAVIDSTGLNPTASRESLVDDEALAHTRDELGAALRRWVRELAIRSPHRLGEFVAIHHLSLKSLVLHDDELAGFITRWLTVDTSAGRMTVEALIEQSPVIRFTETLDEFRQIAGIVRADQPVVNGGYLYDADIVRLLPGLFDGVTVQQVSVVDELDRLAPPPLADHAAVVALEERASAALASVDCSVSVRGIDQADLPSVYVADPDAVRSMDRNRARGVSGGVWGGVLGRVDDSARKRSDRAASGSARLCLNWNNPVVRTLSGLADDTVFDRSVHLLYVQGLLAGHRPLSVKDRDLMTGSLADLIALSVGIGTT